MYVSHRQPWGTRGLTTRHRTRVKRETCGQVSQPTGSKMMAAEMGVESAGGSWER